MAGFFDTLFGGGAEQEAADKNRQLLATYGPQAQGYLTDAYGTGTTAINQAVGAYQPLAALGTQYNKAGALNLDALGVNGPQGNANATAAFQAGPGYQFQFDQGMDALNRRRAAGGMLNSGNADIDAIKFGQGTANQEYQNWLKNLQASGQMGLQATGAAAAGQAGQYDTLAQLAQTYGQNQSGVAGNVLSGNMDANKLQAAGEAAGAKNLLGAGLSLASLGMGAFGGSGGLGSFLGGLGGGGTASTMQVGNQSFPRFT